MNNVRFTYLRDKHNHAFGCVAVSLDRSKNTISYALSVCHSKADVYDRHYGREKAHERLLSEPMVVEYVRLDQCSAHDITRHVMYDIVNRRNIVGEDAFGVFMVQEGLPQRARNYAKAWLKDYSVPFTYTLAPQVDVPREGCENLEAFSRGAKAWATDVSW